MARTALTPIASPGGYPQAISTLTWTAADNVNGNSVPWTGKELILAQNTDVGSQTVTVTSVADREGRSDSHLTTASIAASAYAVVGGPFPSEGWRQTDGNIYLTASAATIKFAVIKLP